MVLRGVFNQELEIEKFEFDIELENIERNVTLIIEEAPYEHVPISIEDPEGKMRMLASFKTLTNFYRIGKKFEDSSNCTTHGELPSGKWKLKLVKPSKIGGDFSLRIVKDYLTGEEKNFPVNLHESPREKSYGNLKGWYKGELHNHTMFSDGEMNLKDITQEIADKNLDFIFPTDHNIVLTSYPETGIPVIQSTELTLDNMGHFNLFGVRKFLDYHNLIEQGESREESLKKIFREVKKSGGLISLNHPFHPGLDLQYNIEMEDIDFLEVINSPSSEGNNTYYDLKALETLDKLWMEGHKIFAVGGSDNHNMSLGDPSSYVHLKQLSEAEILRNMKKGRIYVSRIGEVDIDIESAGKRFYPGDEIKGQVKLEVESAKVLNWRLIKNGEIVERSIGRSWIFMEYLSEGDYIRVEARNRNGEPVVVINPIYCSLKQPEPRKWFEIN